MLDMQPSCELCDICLLEKWFWLTLRSVKGRSCVGTFWKQCWGGLLAHVGVTISGLSGLANERWVD
jgi:hypothetical protein